jgi:hypothetical protein
MSKKSRKRNRRLLKAAALIGGLAMMGRRKRANEMSGLETVSDAQKTTSQLGTAPSVVTNVVKPKALVDNVAANTVLNTAGGIHANKPAKGLMLNARRRARANAVPPSMRGGSPVAQGYLRKTPISKRPGGRGRGSMNWGWTDQPVDTTPTNMSSYYKKGGRVKLAKRGLGKAFTKAKK